MAAYYPRRVARFADLQKAYPGFETYDDFEEDRIESVAITKSRGKGAPKKKRTAAGKWIQKLKEKKEKEILIRSRVQEVWQEEEVVESFKRSFCVSRYTRMGQGRERVRIYIDIWVSRAREKRSIGILRKERGVHWSSSGCSSIYLVVMENKARPVQTNPNYQSSHLQLQDLIAGLCLISCCVGSAAQRNARQNDSSSSVEGVGFDNQILAFISAAC